MILYKNAQEQFRLSDGGIALFTAPEEWDTMLTRKIIILGVWFLF